MNRIIKVLFVVFFICFSSFGNAYADEKDDFFSSMNLLLDQHENCCSVKIPRSISLAQIALETGYGESYAFRKKNNLFGLTLRGRVMKFDNKGESIASYFKSLSFNDAYVDFRHKLSKSRDLRELVVALSKPYSENPEYAVLLMSIINKYSLDQYDI